MPTKFPGLSRCAVSFRLAVMLYWVCSTGYLEKVSIRSKERKVGDHHECSSVRETFCEVFHLPMTWMIILSFHWSYTKTLDLDFLLPLYEIEAMRTADFLLRFPESINDSWPLKVSYYPTLDCKGPVCISRSEKASPCENLFLRLQ